MNYLETLKNITKDKEKRVQNLILLVVLLIIILIASKFIFSSDKKKSNSTSNTSNIDSNKDSLTNETNSLKETQTDLEGKLSNILSQISGIREVSVVITYSEQSKQNPVYNTKEQEKSGEKTTEKSVAYNEQSGSKTAIIESVETPKIEGAIIVAKGASTVEMRSKIASAVATVTSVPVYKIQVFEKEG